MTHDGWGPLTRLASRRRTVAPPPPVLAPDGAPVGPRDLRVFGMGTDWVQVTWRALGPGIVRARAGDVSVTTEADGGPGSVLLAGLPTGRRLTVGLSGDALPDGAVELRAATLTPPPGAELFRLATVNDVHIGQRTTGLLHTLVERPEPAELHPTRCLRAALAELQGWGAQQLVVKGDLAHYSDPAIWAEAASVLQTARIPLLVLPGNHESSTRATVVAAEAFGEHGHRLVRGVVVVDRPGVRLIAGDTTIPGADAGTVARVARPIVEAARRAPGAAMVLLHHQPMQLRWPWYPPPGIPGPEWRTFARALRAANRATIVTTGHTHRHRRHRLSPVLTTEVGSTKDFPGTWAGYQVYEGGIVQTVRRIAEPSCIRWTEYTGRAAFGAWRHWAPGPLGHRCFTHAWST